MNDQYVNTEAQTLTGEHVEFSFGMNWRRFLETISEDKIAQAENSLKEISGLETFKGQSFMDVGSGSGLFSLAALRLGADTIVSVDVDPHSVACTSILKQKFGGNANWQVRRGSILDEAFVSDLPSVSLLYSWGVLHHTGRMWMAVENAMRLVQPKGMFCLALYSHPRNESFHLRLKRLYNRLPGLARPILAVAYAAQRLRTVTFRERQNPISYVRNYGQSSRGMSFWRDVVDWLGGLPCEFASEDEVRKFVED